MATFRRLNDGTRYYGLTWQGWLAAVVAGALLYVAVRFSPLGYKPTITLALFAIAAAGVLLFSLSGQAIGPGRYVVAIVRWRLGPGRYVAPDAEHPVTGGVLVDAVPLALAEHVEAISWWQPDHPLVATNGHRPHEHDSPSGTG
jgi:hypothetical protein